MPTRIWDAYLFHSVPYYSQHKDDVEYDQFNELGTPASLGCIRLMVNDVKWIYDNCDIGTRVIIYDDAEDPGPMGKPGTIYTDPADETLRGWDPTDPDPENPWDDKYLSGTTIRSEAAWDEWNAAQEDGRWNTSLTPPTCRAGAPTPAWKARAGKIKQNARPLPFGRGLCARGGCAALFALCFLPFGQLRADDGGEHQRAARQLGARTSSGAAAATRPAR